MTAHKFGLRISPDKVEDLVQALQRLVEDLRAGRMDRYCAADPARFSRRELTRDLAGLFDRVHVPHARRPR